MAQAIVPVREFEARVKPEKEKENAESETVQRDAHDTVANTGEKPKKRKRATTGDVQTLPV
jgi:hypothetical protein